MRELTKLYCYNFFQMFLVLIPIIVPFWEDKGITLQQIFLLQGIFGAALIVFDIPAGYMADLFGRKKVMVIGSIITALGFQIMWFGQTFTHFVIYELVLGFGLSLQSGTDVALLYAHLEENGEESKKSFLGHRVSMQALGEGSASLIGGWLVIHSLQLPAYVNAITCWLPVFFAASMKEPRGELMPRTSHIENFREIKRALFGQSRRLSYAIWCFMMYGFATYCAVWALQPYWKSRAITVAWFGYLWALNSLFVAIIGKYAHAIEEKLGARPVLIIIAIMPIIGYCGMGLVGGLAGLIFTVAFPICRGLNQVLFQDVINTSVPANMRATTNSIGSLGMRAIFLVFGPLIGYGIDKYGIDHSLSMLGLVYVGAVFVLMIPFIKTLSTPPPPSNHSLSCD